MWSKLFNLLSKNSGESTSFLQNKKNKILLAILSSVLPVVITLLVVIIVLIGPILMAKQYIEDKINDVAVFFDKVGNVLTLNGWCSDMDGSCAKKAEQKYFEQLDNTYSKYKSDGVEIDVELITATIFYGNTLSDDSFQGEEVDTGDSLAEINAEQYENVKLKDVKNLAKNMVSGNKVDYTAYRNYLVSTYIPSRFSHLYSSGSDKENDINRIADEIMSFASYDNGKGQGSSFVSCNIVNTSCSGITISNGTYAGTYTLEEYIAGVVNREVGTGWPDEAIKAQAIAARSFALNYTNNCTKVIPNSEGVQTFKPATDQRIIDLVNETSGMVMTYEDKIINAQYASWWGNNKGTSCGSYNSCTNGQCSLDIYKAPNNEKWTFTMPQNYFAWGNVTDNIQMQDQTIQSLGGHCRGMTQFGAKYLDLELNYKYDEILSTFYSDGVVISTFGNSTNSCSQVTTSTGLIASNYSGFLQRISNPTKNDYYYSQDYFYSSNVGQCVWYAKRRALEIINTISIDETKRAQAEEAVKNTYGNGKDWWNNPSLKMFGESTDYTQPRVGALVVWRYTDKYAKTNYKGINYGHIGVIESVDYTKQTVIVSEGWKKNWEAPNTIDYASFSIKEHSFDWLKNYGRPGDYEFIGYVYLLD